MYIMEKSVSCRAESPRTQRGEVEGGDRDVEERK